MDISASIVLYKNEKSLKKNILEKNILQAKVFLENYNSMLTCEQKDILNNFINLNKENFLKKRYLLVKYKFFKHGLIRNIGLFLKV